MIQGGCYCGRIRYASDATPFNETICHCRDCQRIAGAPRVAWFSVPKAGFRFTAEAPILFRSSAHAIRRFCGSCGATLTYERDDLDDEIDVTTASLDDPNAVPPKDHTRTRERLAWDAIDDGLPDLPDGRLDAGVGEDG